MEKNYSEQFKTILTMQRYSQNSIKNYVSNLNYFLKISSKFKPEEIMQKQLEDFIIWLVDKKKVGHSHQKAMMAKMESGADIRIIKELLGITILKLPKYIPILQMLTNSISKVLWIFYKNGNYIQKLINFTLQSLLFVSYSFRADPIQVQYKSNRVQ